MKRVIENQAFDEERALYGIADVDIKNCVFDGPRDGESVLKEARGITVSDCRFSLRYPMWHNSDFVLLNSVMDSNTRAPLWYSSRGAVLSSEINGIKAVRECSDVSVKNCRIKSDEFGWKCRSLGIEDCTVESEYFLLDSGDIRLSGVRLIGKYSFQYTRNAEIRDCLLDTKDAFWHAKNIVVRDSVVNGEYLGWYSDGLTLINCSIQGTQPFCYCKNLKLVGCVTKSADLAFEYSDVQADIKGRIESVKNPRSGIITADEVGQVIMGNAVMKCSGKVIVGKNG